MRTLARVAELGIRQLRGELATVVRRAAAGDSIDISVGGRAVARLGPLVGTSAAPAALADLIATGAVIAPRRSDARAASGAVVVWRNVRLDRLLREIRG